VAHQIVADELSVVNDTCASALTNADCGSVGKSIDRRAT
jgi:hypothetical protein